MIAEALWDLMKAKDALEKGKAECDREWGYFLHDESERVKRAEDELVDAIARRMEERKTIGLEATDD